METIKLSVVIPAYKFSKFLEVSLLTVLNQRTNFDFEVIVRDDFSEDGSDKILSRLKGLFPNLIVHEATENWGFHKNIKFLLEQAKGEYIAYLDGDDYYVDPLKLQKQVDFLDANPKYVMHGTGYCILKGDNEYIPGDGFSTYWSLIDTVSTTNLFEHNYVGFGRVFRNIPGIYKEYMDALPYIDYPINYELSLHGLIKNEQWYGGVYREHFGGVLTSLDADKKTEVHNYMKNFLKDRYQNYMNSNNKIITILDCYVHSDEIEQKLINAIQNLKSVGHDIFLISNTTVKQSIIDTVDFYFYDKNNILFSENKFVFDPLVLYKIMDGLEIYENVSGVQRHGLSVMINLSKSLKISKELGYKYFQRIEVDAVTGDSSIDFMKQVPTICSNSDKKGLFYFNEDNISFQYFYCDIDFFLNNVKEIKSEYDYLDYLNKNFGSNKFRIVEQYVHHNLLKNSEQLLIRNHEDMKSNFSDTNWNTVTSESNISDTYNGCTTNFYKVFDSNMTEQDQIAILSYNYRDTFFDRKIIAYDTNKTTYEIIHHLPNKGSWSYNLFTSNIKNIEVYENEICIFEKENIDTKSYIVLK